MDLIIYKNHCALIERLNLFLGDQHKHFICRRCLSSYTSENMIMIHEPKCENNDITTIGTSNESHLHWKNHFHKNHYNLGYMQTSKLIMKKIILV